MNELRKKASKPSEDSEGARTAASPEVGGPDRKPEKREQRAQVKAQHRQESDERAATDLAKYGRKVGQGVFGGRTIRFYDKGFVQVTMPLSGSRRFERLLAVEASSDVFKKSGLGRGAAAVATLGLNLASSNKRGDVYLTITTEVTTHVLHEAPPTQSNLKSVKSLEASGNAILRANGPLPTADSAPVKVESSTAQKLRELAALREDGLVSAEEYQVLRAKLLDTL